jgi:hypothetical protein
MRRAGSRSLGAKGAAVALAATVALAVAGCTTQQAPKPTVRQLTQGELQKQVVSYLQKTITLAGNGPWRLDTPGNDPTAPAWSPESRAEAAPCSATGSTDEYQLTIQVYGPPAADPSASAKAVYDGWKKAGYDAGIVSPLDRKNEDLIQIAATSPDGTEIGYSASKGITGINVESVCSADPSLRRG